MRSVGSLRLGGRLVVKLSANDASESFSCGSSAHAVLRCRDGRRDWIRRTVDRCTFEEGLSILEHALDIGRKADAVPSDAVKSRSRRYKLGPPYLSRSRIPTYSLASRAGLQTNTRRAQTLGVAVHGCHPMLALGPARFPAAQPSAGVLPVMARLGPGRMCERTPTSGPVSCWPPRFGRL
jgi:hypothetical protein